MFNTFMELCSYSPSTVLPHIYMCVSVTLLKVRVCQPNLFPGDTATGSGSVHTQDKSHSSKTSKSSHPTSSKFGLRYAIVHIHNRCASRSVQLFTMYVTLASFCSDIYEKTEYDSSHSKSNARSGHTRSMKYHDDVEPESYTPGYDVSVLLPAVFQNQAQAAQYQQLTVQ